MNRRYNSLIVFYVLCICVVVTIGASAAYFTSFTNNEDGSTIYAKGGTMSVSYSNSSGDIVMENIYPKEEAWVTKNFTITGKKTTLLKMNYRLILSVDNNEFTYPITYSISGISDLAEDIDLVHEDNIQIIKNGYQVMGEGSFSDNITGTITHTYTLNIFYKPQKNFNQNVDQEASFAAKVLIDDGLQELPSSLIGKMLGVNNSNVKASYVTKPGSQIATTDEGLIKSTDDYGEMYYYRGNVQNNYIVFANMCWRIVRTTGTGGIKITLFNRGAKCSNINYGAFAFSGQQMPYQFNVKSNSNSYVGLLYGTVAGEDYTGTHLNDSKSNILNILESFYNIYLYKYDNKLEDAIWCNDKNIVSGNGAGDLESYYGGYARIKVDKNPAFICSKDYNDGNLSKLTVSDTTYGNGALDKLIGLLTADEVAMAGGMYQTVNSSYYLLENTTTFAGWWTSTPYNFYGTDAYVLGVVRTGALNEYKVSEFLGVRPALVLKSTVIASGSGTKTDPYIVA